MSRSARLSALTAIALALPAQAARAESAMMPAGLGDAVLRDAGGAPVQLAQLLGGHRFTVVVFYSGTCPCFAAHVDRLQRLAAELGPQGVGFVLVDSERHGAAAPSRTPLVAPALPLYRDEEGRLARRLGALYATESFVLDPGGVIRYRGGIDGDRKYLRADTPPYLRQALLDLIAGKAPAFASSKALGCALRLL
jgi:hypothetical protein